MTADVAIGNGSGRLDEFERRIINALQEDFPIAPAPFALAGRRIGLDEKDVIEGVGGLLTRGQLSRFGPLYNIEAMGGAFCLCAIAVPPARFDEVAEIINARDEVAHNYEREHSLNMWFVLAVENEDDISNVISQIEAQTRLDVLALPKIEEFFVAFKVLV